MGETHLLVGTRKGLFIGRSADRRAWTLDGPHFPGWSVDYAVRDPRDGRVWAAVSHLQWGPHLHVSADSGRTWREATTPAFPAGADPYLDRTWHGGTWVETSVAPSVKQIWTIEPGPATQPGLLYAGVNPAALFISRDAGATWENCDALWRHPTRDAWFPMPAGLVTHTVQVDPMDPAHLYVAAAAAGVFATHDGGATWEPRNQGVTADFLPDGGKDLAVGQCPQSFWMHPQRPDRLYQKHRTGVFRSDNGGRSWTNISAGIPDPQYGFASAIDPADPDTLFVVPLESDQVHAPANGRLTLYRSRDSGNTWQPLTRGLAARPIYHSVYRQALGQDGASTRGRPLGLYLGTSGGVLFASDSGGAAWRRIAEGLPPVLSVRAATTD